MFCLVGSWRPALAPFLAASVFRSTPTTLSFFAVRRPPARCSYYQVISTNRILALLSHPALRWYSMALRPRCVQWFIHEIPPDVGTLAYGARHYVIAALDGVHWVRMVNTSVGPLIPLRSFRMDLCCFLSRVVAFILSSASHLSFGLLFPIPSPPGAAARAGLRPTSRWLLFSFQPPYFSPQIVHVLASSSSPYYFVAM